MDGLAMLFLTAGTFLIFQGGLIGCLAEMTVKLEDFEQCEDQPETTIILQEVKLTKTGPYTMKVDATLEITAEIEDLQFDIYLTKCESRDQAHTCTQDLKTTLNNICEHLAEKDKMWSEGVEHILEFDPHCPIKPGVYQMKDAEFDTESLSQYPAIDGYWKMKNVGKDNGKIVSCQRMDVSIDTGLPDLL